MWVPWGRNIGTAWLGFLLRASTYQPVLSSHVETEFLFWEHEGCWRTQLLAAAGLGSLLPDGHELRVPLRTYRPLSAPYAVCSWTIYFVPGQQKSIFAVLNRSNFYSAHLIRSGPPRIISLFINSKSTDCCCWLHMQIFFTSSKNNNIIMRVKL